MHFTKIFQKTVEIEQLFYVKWIHEIFVIKPHLEKDVDDLDLNIE